MPFLKVALHKCVLTVLSNVYFTGSKTEYMNNTQILKVKSKHQ